MSDETIDPTTDRRVGPPIASAATTSGSQTDPGPPPAPWEINPNTFEHPRAPAGTRYAAYQGAPSSAGVAAPTDAAFDFDVADPADTSRKIKLGAVAGLGVLLVGIVTYNFIPAAVAAPTAFVRFASPDARFACDVPEHWDVKSFAASNDGDNAIGGALIKNGPAKIDFTTDTVSDLRAAVLL